MGAPRTRSAPGRLRSAALRALALAAVLCLALPAAAQAAPLDDFSDWVSGLIRSGVVWMASGANEIVGEITAGLALDVPLDQLLGGAAAVGAYDYALDVMNGIVKPVAGTILAFCLVVELMRVAERADSSQVMPGVRQIAAIVAYFALFSLLIGHAEAVCTLIYEVGRTVLRAATSAGAAAASMDVAALERSLEAIEGNVWAHVVALVDMAVGWGALTLAWVVSLFSVWGRALQIYVYLMFAPVPLALLGTSETRQMGVGYLRNFAAACLASTVMVFVLYLFTILLDSVMAEYAGAWLNLASDDVAVVGATVELVALCALLIFALVKSGQFAREVLGG